MGNLIKLFSSDKRSSRCRQTKRLEEIIQTADPPDYAYGHRNLMLQSKQFNKGFSWRMLHWSVEAAVSLSYATSSSSICLQTVAYPGIFFGGGSTNSVEDRGQRGRGSGGGRPLVRGSGGSCNLVQEISFHIVKFS